MAKLNIKPASYTDKKNTDPLLRPRGVKNELPSRHPINNEKNHALLLAHIKQRLEENTPVRDALVTRCENIDKQMHAEPTLSVDDKKRDVDNKEGKTPKPTNHNLPLVAAQIDEAVTYLLSVFAPNGELFDAVAGPAKQQMVQALVKILNDGGLLVDYYGELHKFLINALSYNLAAISVLWENRYGVELSNKEGGTILKEIPGTIWEGNRIRSLDMYNFLYDSSVHPTKLPTEGEWFGWVEKKTPFRCRKMEQESVLHNVDYFITTAEKSPGLYWRAKPTVRNQYKDTSIDFSAALRGQSGQVINDVKGVELITWIGWLSPADFGLGEKEDTDYKIFRVVVAAGEYIAFVEELNSTSGMLPVCVATPVINDLDNEQRSPAEQLLPFQHFSSFLMNAHQEATRKALYGVKFYDRTIFPNLETAQEDMVSGWVPTRSVAQGADLNKAIKIVNDAPATENNVVDIGRVEALMQKILPTDMLKQVTDLDRATKFQAAATVQASSRRALKMARVIMSQALVPMRTLMAYNMYLFQPATDVSIDGQKIQISPAVLREEKLEFEIAGGIKGLDRLMMMQVIYEVITIAVQSPHLVAEIDITKMMNYYTTLAGDDTNLLAFKRTEPATPPPAPITEAERQGVLQ